MLLNEKLNDTAHKMMWLEVFHTYKRVRNGMDITGSTKSPFGNFYGEKQKTIGSFSKFGRIGYVTKRDKFKNQMADKTFK